MMLESECIELPYELTGSLSEQAKQIMKLMSEGRLSIEEAHRLLESLQEKLPPIDMADIEARISRLEKLLTKPC